MEYGFTGLEPKALEQIEGDAFEEFCEELLRFERDVRHPGADVAGPAPRYTGDAGKDLRLTTKALPTKAKEFFPNAITEDHIGQTFFSCKGGSAWAMSVLKDVQSQPGPLQVLAAGGHFTVLTHRKVDLTRGTNAFAAAVSGRTRVTKAKGPTSVRKTTQKATFHEALTAVLRRRLEDQGVNSADIRDRVHVYDASHLAAFLKQHRPSISSRFASQLGVRRLAYLVGLDGWARELRARTFPAYVPDFSRTSLIETLRAVVRSTASAPSERSVWVHGPPGVGKSRLVLEALQQDPQPHEIERRVVVATSDNDASNAISAGILDHSSDVILVVDECSAERVGDLSTRFIARSSQAASPVIIMIGPLPRPGQDVPASALRLDRLDETACRELVRSMLGIGPTTDEPLVDRVLKLCEGYPWSAVLISEALRADRNALPEGATHWNACELMLVGKAWRELDGPAEALRRAKAILAVLLTDRLDWGSAGLQTMEAVARAVGLPSSSELTSAAAECDARGLLRRRLDWKYKYVTPNNISRQVAIHLLGPPHNTVQLIRHHCPSLMSSLHDQLRDLAVPISILEALADDELDGLEQDPPGLGRISRGDPGGTTLSFVAQHRPRRMAALLRTVVEAATVDEWDANGQARLVLGSVLTKLSRRRASFDAAEAALYRLAVEEQRLGTTQAVASWSSLFLVHLNPTYLPYSERIGRLWPRILKGETAEKKVAIRALEVSISQHESRTGGDPLDGPWLNPTNQEAAEAHRMAWNALFALLSHADVAESARKAIVTHLRSGIRTGVGDEVLRLLAVTLSLWPADEYLKLRQVLDQIGQYDGAWLERDAAAKALHERLTGEVKPSSFHERLVDAVGRWRSWQGKTTFKESEAFTAALDDELAREGLRGDMPIKGELDWLESPAASRSVQFMAAVGRADVSRGLLTTLETRCREGHGHDLVAGYLSGVAAVGGAADVDAALRRWRSSPQLALATFLSVWRVGPSDERIAWLIADLQSGHLAPDVFRWLELGGWGARADAGPLRSLAAALLATNERVAHAAALSLLLARVDADPSRVSELLDILGDAVMKLARVPDPDTMLAYHWELGCKKLHDAGRDDLVIRAAIDALGSSESVGFADRVWHALNPLLASHGTRIWALLTPLLEATKDASRILVDLRGSGLLRHVPPSDVLRWVGADRRRQIAVAQMCGAYEVPLNPLARAIIAKYGADSPAAAVLSGRAHSTPAAVSSLAQFAREQLANAREWARDRNPEVARWGARMVNELKQSAEEFEAHEEYEKRRRG